MQYVRFFTGSKIHIHDQGLAMLCGKAGRYHEINPPESFMKANLCLRCKAKQERMEQANEK